MVSVAANLLHDFSLLSGINRNFLLVGLMFVVAIALVRYTRFVLVAAMFILAVGANLPHDIAQILNVDSRILMGSLITILVLSLLNQFISLPTGLDKPQEFPDQHDSADINLLESETDAPVSDSESNVIAPGGQQSTRAGIPACETGRGRSRQVEYEITPGSVFYSQEIRLNSRYTSASLVKLGDSSGRFYRAKS